MKVMGGIQSEPEEEKGNFWFSNTGLPLNDKYRPIFEKYFEVRRTAGDFKGTSIFHISNQTQLWKMYAILLVNKSYVNR